MTIPVTVPTTSPELTGWEKSEANPAPTSPTTVHRAPKLCTTPSESAAARSVGAGAVVRPPRSSTSICS